MSTDTLQIPGMKIVGAAGVQDATGNQQVTVGEWTAQFYAPGRLQITVTVTPVDASASILSLTSTAMQIGAPRPTVLAGAVAAMEGPTSAPGATVGSIAFTDLYDPATQGSTINVSVSGLVLPESGPSQGYYFSQQIQVQGT
jgi:hypothetical protein